MPPSPGFDGTPNNASNRRISAANARLYVRTRVLSPFSENFFQATCRSMTVLPVPPCPLSLTIFWPSRSTNFCVCGASFNIRSIRLRSSPEGTIALKIGKLRILATSCCSPDENLSPSILLSTFDRDAIDVRNSSPVKDRGNAPGISICESPRIKRALYTQGPSTYLSLK